MSCEKLLQKGNEYLDNNDLHNALSYFDKAAKIYPNSQYMTQVNKVRMFILERLNKLDRASHLCNKYKDIDDVGLQRVRAIILKRLEKYGESLQLSHNLLQRKDLDDKSNYELNFLIASIYDKKDKPDKAIEFYTKGNEVVRSLPNNLQFNKDYVLTFIDLMKNNFKEINENRIEDNLEYNDPIFLIGFPRSGTTLLNTILNANKNIECLEEKQTFPINHRLMVRDGRNSIDFFKNLSKNQINEMRKFYWEGCYELGDHNKLIVDKLPLRFLDIGILNKIFPNAKYIFDVRHPLDCVLSCFMQNFEINDDMANFYTLEDSSEFYKKSLELFKKYTENLDLNIHYIYYENLIDDFENEVKKLTDFIGTEFDENMISYYENVGDSTTPSYSQVIRKPYRESMYRYKRYEDYVEYPKQKVDKFIKWFKYN